jgi:hypothetical protein
MVSAPRKRIKVTDEAKAARLREDRKRTASNGVSTAIQKGNDAKKRHQAKLVLRADLESRAKEGKNK